VPDFLNRVVVVSGDISEKGLALSDDVYNDLCQEVNVVFHSAASVNFDENIKSSVRTNVNGTMEIISLCKSMPNLKVISHFSVNLQFL
jgi:fatty acyl-CoA reductase